MIATNESLEVQFRRERIAVCLAVDSVDDRPGGYNEWAKASLMRTVLVRNADGDAIATVCLAPENQGPRLTIDRVVAGKGRLLHYYFGKGLRGVLLQSGDFRMSGMLSTRWHSAERRWFVDLQAMALPGRGDSREDMRREEGEDKAEGDVPGEYSEVVDSNFVCRTIAKRQVR